VVNRVAIDAIKKSPVAHASSGLVGSEESSLDLVLPFLQPARSR
jgi:hypothetical protein